MGTDDRPRRDSREPVGKSAHDAGHAVDTTPTTRVHVPNTDIRESAHDVNFSVDTTPTSRVAVLKPAEPAPTQPVPPPPVTRPDVNTGGNATADR